MSQCVAVHPAWWILYHVTCCSKAHCLHEIIPISMRFTMTGAIINNYWPTKMHVCGFDNHWPIKNCMLDLTIIDQSKCVLDLMHFIKNVIPFLLHLLPRCYSHHCCVHPMADPLPHPHGSISGRHQKKPMITCYSAIKPKKWYACHIIIAHYSARRTRIFCCSEICGEMELRDVKTK